MLFDSFIYFCMGKKALKYTRIQNNGLRAIQISDLSQLVASIRQQPSGFVKHIRMIQQLESTNL